MLCMLCQVVAVLAPSHGQIPLYRRSARGIRGMWWSRVKSCAVKETCREQAITSEQIWTTSSYNNDWQFGLPYAQLWQFLWENVWQIYWILLALFWAFCDSCLLLGHRVTTLRSENTELWKFWTSTAFDRLSFAIEGTAPGAIGARHEVSRGASRRSWSFPLRVERECRQISPGSRAELPSLPRPERWNLKWALPPKFPKHFWTNLDLRRSLRSFLFFCFLYGTWKVYSVYSFCSIAFSDMQSPHSAAAQGSFWPHCDDVVRTMSREGREMCDFVDSTQRLQPEKTSRFVAGAPPSWWYWRLQSLEFTFHNSPFFHRFFNGVNSDDFIVFHVMSDIPGWRRCLSTSRAPNVAVKNVHAAPPGQGCQGVGRFWEGF